MPRSVKGGTRIFRGINKLLPVRFRGESDERYWEAYVIFQAADDAEADKLFERLSDSLCEGEGPDHDCPHFRFSSLRPLEPDEGVA